MIPPGHRMPDSVAAWEAKVVEAAATRSVLNQPGGDGHKRAGTGESGMAALWECDRRQGHEPNFGSPNGGVSPRRNHLPRGSGRGRPRVRRFGRLGFQPDGKWSKIRAYG